MFRYTNLYWHFLWCLLLPCNWLLHEYTVARKNCTWRKHHPSVLPIANVNARWRSVYFLPLSCGVLLNCQKTVCRLYSHKTVFEVMHVHEWERVMIDVICTNMFPEQIRRSGSVESRDDHNQEDNNGEKQWGSNFFFKLILVVGRRVLFLQSLRRQKYIGHKWLKLLNELHNFCSCDVHNPPYNEFSEFWLLVWTLRQQPFVPTHT